MDSEPHLDAMILIHSSLTLQNTRDPGQYKVFRLAVGNSCAFIGTSNDSWPKAFLVPFKQQSTTQQHIQRDGE